MPLRPRVVTCLLLLAALPAHPQVREEAPYRNPRLSVVDRVKDLLGRMTPEEKSRQLFMLPGDLDDPSHDYRHGVFGLQISTGKRTTGSPADVAAPETARRHAERINAIQRSFVEETRLGIPIIPFDEAVHGLAREGATVFPQG